MTTELCQSLRKTDVVSNVCCRVRSPETEKAETEQTETETTETSLGTESELNKPKWARLAVPTHKEVPRKHKWVLEPGMTPARLWKP